MAACDTEKQPSPQHQQEQDLVSSPVPSSPISEGFMQKFRLYQTLSKFYLIGRDKSRAHWRVLKIDRTELSELNMREDLTTYTERECSDLLRRIHEGNRSTGGLKFVTTCYGIVGFIKFLGPYYMLLITKRRQIGAICGHTVYAITKSEIIPLPSAATRSKMVNYRSENRSKQYASCKLRITKRRQIGAICGHTVYAITKSEMIPLPSAATRSKMVNYRSENSDRIGRGLLFRGWIFSFGVPQVFLYVETLFGGFFITARNYTILLHPFQFHKSGEGEWLVYQVTRVVLLGDAILHLLVPISLPSNHTPLDPPENLELPIALRKDTQTCKSTYPIANFVSYDRLSSAARSLIVSRNSISVPKTVKELDIKTVFLRGDLQNEGYMEQPPGFIAQGKYSKVCYLKKSLYGLKQSSGAWLGKFSEVV
ncbi:Phosphoinositide phosphatase SAC3 [Capsicum chinense]|nr:Phosphoinositide phosphatase SAC3 [Capsicum chinense]